MSDEKPVEEIADLAYKLAGWSVAGAGRRSCDQTPRDVLVDTLAMIDSGQIKPDAMLIIVREPSDKAGESITHLKSACADVGVALTMLHDAAAQMRALVMMHLGTRK